MILLGFGGIFFAAPGLQMPTFAGWAAASAKGGTGVVGFHFAKGISDGR